VNLDGSFNNTISNNTASGNTYEGVFVTGASVRNTFTNNTISCNGLGCTTQPGTGDGVRVTGESSGNTFINNAIFNNAGYGVQVKGSGTVGNAILSNSIYSNADLGIYLSDGGNDHQPPPDSVTAQLQASVITVSGTVIARNGYTGMFQVQVFGNQGLFVNPDFSQQGEQLLGSGNFRAGEFTLAVPEGTWPSGTTSYITVTATPVDGLLNTSEFSTAAGVTQ
jgi:parallel beta-helix repeat protein